MYGALESVAMLWRLRSYRNIIIIIIISTTVPTCDSCADDQRQRDFLRKILELRHFGGLALLQQAQLVPSALHRGTLLGKERRRTSTASLVRSNYYYRVLRAICCQPVDGSLI